MNFSHYGIKVLMNVLKYMTVRHPIIFYGFPGLALIIMGAIIGGQFIEAYLNHQTVYFGSLFGAIVLFLFGAILMVTAVLLFAMSTLIREKQ